MHIRTISFGPLLAWSASAAAMPDTTILNARDNYYCNNAHIPSISDCQQLYSSIESGEAYANLETANPRTIRSGSCFVSWSNNVVGTSQDLVPYISTLINSCVVGQRRSGIVKNVHLRNQNQATAICVSNRGKGCQN